MLYSRVTALAACLSVASAQSIRGFNTGATELDGSVKDQAAFMAEFQNQKNIEGLNGAFTNARLYTSIQGGSTNSPIEAIPAAIASNTGLLLGLWASAGQENINNEIAAIQNAISQYGSSFTKLVRGISVGSEDLYRISPTGIKNDGLPGAEPAVLASYITQVRNALKGTALSGASIGHVDTWNVWKNSSNSAVYQACDWVGVDEYPYYQSQDPNPISNAKNLFYEALATTKSSTGKPVWVTEAGWPVSGPTVGQAVASLANARTFWEQVYCTLPADVPVFWYTQRDANAGNAAQFGVTGASLTTTPLYDLSCDGVDTSTAISSSVVSSSTSSASASKSSSTSSVSTVSSASRAISSAAVALASSAASVRESVSSHAASATSVAASATSAAASSSARGPSGLSSVVSSASSVISPSASTTPFGNTAASSNHVSVLALLAVPALLAFMA